MTVEEDEDDDEEDEEGQLNSHNVNCAVGRVKISNSCMYIRAYRGPPERGNEKRSESAVVRIR